MGRAFLASSLLLMLLISVLVYADARAQLVHGTADGSEQWGYARVRPKAHLFWWLYRSPNRVDNGTTAWPTVLWLQGGPGGSGVGIGNFEEIGPLDINMNPRNSTWLQKADLLFVDNPVGTGYSFVGKGGEFVKTDVEAAIDMATLLKDLYRRNVLDKHSPLFLVAESYGGKYAVTLGVSILRLIKSGELTLIFGGVALGDSWISSYDFVASWAPLLRDVSRLDEASAVAAHNITERIKEELAQGDYANATTSWGELENVIQEGSASVDFYNFLLDSDKDPISSLETYATYLSKRYETRAVSTEGNTLYNAMNASAVSSEGNTLYNVMNGVVKDKLKIIPKVWGQQSPDVFAALSGDFMRPRIDEVDELLAAGVDVTIYNGQLDVICSTMGAESWVKKLKWDGLEEFNKQFRHARYCNNDSSQPIGALHKSYSNLHFYWILKAGHFVPVDQPCIALNMIAAITSSPAGIFGPSIAT